MIYAVHFFVFFGQVATGKQSFLYAGLSVHKRWVNMAVPISGCPRIPTSGEKKQKTNKKTKKTKQKVHMEQVFPLRNVLQGTITSAHKVCLKFFALLFYTLSIL